jgi:hypothetical protein
MGDATILLLIGLDSDASDAKARSSSAAPASSADKPQAGSSLEMAICRTSDVDTSEPKAEPKPEPEACKPSSRTVASSVLTVPLLAVDDTVNGDSVDAISCRMCGVSQIISFFRSLLLFLEYRHRS